MIWKQNYYKHTVISKKSWIIKFWHSFLSEPKAYLLYLLELKIWARFVCEHFDKRPLMWTLSFFCCVGTWKNLGLKLRLQRRSCVTNGAHFEMTHLKNVKNAANFGRLNSCLMTFNFGLGTRIQNNFPWSPEESFIKIKKWLYSKWSIHGKIIWKRKLLTWIFILDIVLWAFSFFIIW